jgi:hypothetical protein
VELDRLPQWTRNPFAPVHAPTMAAVDVVEPAAEPLVEAPPDVDVATILISPTRRVAMVNGKRARVGDRIGLETVVDIRADGIVLESPLHGRRTILRRAPGGR